MNRREEKTSHNQPTSLPCLVFLRHFARASFTSLLWIRYARQCVYRFGQENTSEVMQRELPRFVLRQCAVQLGDDRSMARKFLSRSVSITSTASPSVTASASTDIVSAVPSSIGVSDMLSSWPPLAASMDDWNMQTPL